MTPRIETTAAPVPIRYRPMERDQVPSTGGSPALPSHGTAGQRAHHDQPRHADATRPPQPTTRVDYHQARSVLKFHDQRGTLIYQIPPAGALQLIEQADDVKPSLSVWA